jgi:hypothetical protein
MLKQICKLLILGALYNIYGCADKHLSQMDVARDFWTAMAANDIAKAKTYAIKGTMDGITPNQDATVDKIDLRKPHEENGQTFVPTTVTGANNGEQKTMSFNTVLAKEDGDWKVDFTKTTTAMMGVSMQEVMEGMGKAMGDAMKGMGEAVGKGLGGSQPATK